MNNEFWRIGVGSESSACLSHGPLVTDSIPGVQRRNFVRFGQGRVIESIVDKIIQRAFQGQHRLPDVDQFGRAFTYDMHAE